MFTILKPEMRRCIEALDPYLTEAGFKIDSRHSIPNWTSTAKEIYSFQLSDPKFASEFGVYLWMTKNFFGDSAVAYQISRGESLEDDLKHLMQVKSTFRSDLSRKLDDPINFMVNLDKLSTYQPTKLGKRGTIMIEGAPLEEGNFDGRWDYFFFKHIHTSDNTHVHEKEEGVLRAHGIYNDQINEEQWNQMVEMGTLTPPRKEVYSNG